MGQSTNWRVRHASVVLVAESHIDPTSIAPSELRSAGVIPPDWTVTNEVIIPVFAEIAYANGVRMRTEGNRCIFQQESNIEFPDKYEIHDMATKYVAGTELAIRYQAVGINWQLDVQPDIQSSPLLQTLLNESNDLAGFQPQSIQMVKPLDGKTCNLTFTANQGEVSVAVNYHYQLSERRARQIIATWPECQKHLRQEIIAAILPRNLA